MYIVGADVLYGYKCVKYFCTFCAFVYEKYVQFFICIEAFVYVLYMHMCEEI
jgi:hypothetical protein